MDQRCTLDVVFKRLRDAVLDAPDADGPRLALANHLDERGYPRGEFIRVQVTLARMPTDAKERRALEMRERALLAAHGKRWLSAKLGITRGVAVYACSNPAAPDDSFLAANASRATAQAP